MENKDSFEYTYSAPEQEEIRAIREKYQPRPVRETKMDQLRRLDAGVAQKGALASITLGVISVLVMGTGMSMCLVFTDYFIPGVVVGVLGLAGVCMAYPVYTRVTRKERERIAPEILRLTDELMQ